MTEDQLKQETLAGLAESSDTLFPRLISGQLRRPEVSHLFTEAF